MAGLYVEDEVSVLACFVSESLSDETGNEFLNFMPDTAE